MQQPNACLGVKMGAPCKDLTCVLGIYFWPHQQHVPSMLLVNDSQQYYWKLHCHHAQHLTLMTVQGAARALNKLQEALQAATPEGTADASSCNVAHGVSCCPRCQHNYRQLGPSTSTEVHRSYAEQVAWIHLENVLRSPQLLVWMCSFGDGMFGHDMGYVVEVRVVKGWMGKVDIFVPHLKFIIQVDGNHHQQGKQLWTDSMFNAKAVHDGHRVLRLFHSDAKAFDSFINKAVHRCIQDMNITWVMCTPHHPLLNDAYAVPVIFQK